MISDIQIHVEPETPAKWSRRPKPSCAICGATCKTHKDKYCSKACYDSRQKKHSNPTKCEVCGDVFKPRGNSAGRCCSRECGFQLLHNEAAARAKPVMIDHPPMPCECKQCGGLFIQAESSALYCSNDCKIRFHYRAKVQRSEAVQVSCTHCGNQFSRSIGDNLRWVCSTKCRDTLERVSKRKSRSMRRAMQAGATVEAFDPVEILERDGWRCQLCGVRTPKKLRGTIEPTAPELDHIIPLSAGGEHSRRNTQCACRSCNGMKSNSIIGQLLLIG